MTLKPWREVIVPHEDVLEGTFDESEFAADLTKVVRGVAKPEYQDPVRFFERTVITEGMALLLQSVVRRLNGKGGDPVVQLQTAFGGGKTHTMMAVLHVASGAVAPKNMHGVAALLDKAKVKELPRAKVAVLDGNELAPSQPQKHGRIVANTLWGELAWQLGQDDGYAMVAAADQDGTSPGKGVLAALLEQFAPVVILMDEVVAYLRQFEPGKSYNGGTYDSNLSFLQALTEAVSQVPNAMLLASLPESMMEVGDQRGQQALDNCQKVFGRIEAVWKPVATDEAFEIVRRRLFKAVQVEAARDEACEAFAALYQEHPDKFPGETREGTYLRRLKASYPIHPEVFERLYEDWSTLPKFQRTRGVLRLMARLVHSLWRSDNRDLLILPGSIPLDDYAVRNELIKYLPGGWDPILDKDVDGATAEPRRIDDSTPTLGSIQACRRVARTIFLGSAPSVSGQTVRGIGVERVRLGCAQPTQSPARYDDALRRLIDRLHYFYSNNERYWFDLRPTLRREMEDRCERFDAKLHVYPELQERLAKTVRSSLVHGVHIFVESKDVRDDAELRLVVLDPDCAHRRRDPESKAVKTAEAILARHGDKPREYQNRLLFLAPDANSVQTLRDQTRRYLAWRSIVEDADQLNLDTHHRKDAQRSLDEAASRLEGSLKETYRLLLVPMQEIGAKGELLAAAWEDEALNLAGTNYDKAIASVVREKEWVISAWAPTHLANLLSRWFWKPEAPTIGIQRVWLDTCRYLYLPRLASSDVFLDAVRNGVVGREWFGYALADQGAGGLRGLVFGASGSIYLDAQAVLVQPDVAERALATATPVAVVGLAPSSQHGVGSGVGATTVVQRDGGVATAVTVTALPRRFHAAAELPAADPIGAFADIVQNVIEHFTAQYGTQVSISVDVEARCADGFESKLVRIVKENAATLKFRIAEFEDE